ncbi:hypothetical protein HJFPF1_12970 [Paramyrothecium foliicola]|nr:hypothetical protein HJFPF1_12970 [Paramyrothecium foliicola]
MSAANQVPMEQNYLLEPRDDNFVWCEMMHTLTSEKDYEDITDPMLPECSLDFGQLLLDPWVSMSESLHGSNGIGLGEMHDHSRSLTMTSSDLGRSPQTSLPEWSPEPVTTFQEYLEIGGFHVQARPTHATAQVSMARWIHCKPSSSDNGQK